MFHFPFKYSTLRYKILLVFLTRLSFAIHFAKEKWAFILWAFEFKSETETFRKKFGLVFLPYIFFLFLIPAPQLISFHFSCACLTPGSS